MITDEEGDLMYCEKCGSRLEPGDLYCPGCGNKLTGDHTQQYQGGSRQPRKKPESDGREKVLYVLLGVVAVLLIIGIIWGVVTLISLNREEERYTAAVSDTKQEQTADVNGNQDSDTVDPVEVPGTTTAPAPTQEPAATEEPIVTPAPIPSQTPVPAQESNSAADGDYVIPDSSSRLLGSSDLSGLSEWELRIARNEIYARHGRMFNDSALDSYFRGKSWYVPSIAAENFDDNTYLSKTELKNAKLISDYEASMGYE